MDIKEIQANEDRLPQTPMPSYISHKRVWALKIKQVHEDDNGQGIALTFERPGYAMRAFTRSQLAHKPVPLAGWYLVLYEGGYISFSPPEEFEKGYRSTDEVVTERQLKTVTVTFGKPAITPDGEVATVKITQEHYGIESEILLTRVQAVKLAEQIKARVYEQA